MIAGDRRAAVANAKQHLNNFALVVAEQTAFALRNAPAGLHPTPPEGSSGSGSSADAFQRYLVPLYGGLDLPYNGRVMLFRTDGTLLTVFPVRSGLVGRSFGTHPLFATALPRAPAGAIETSSVFDGGERLLAYRTVNDHPLLVAVSAPMGDVLSGWWREVSIVGAGSLVIVLLGAFGTYRLGRQLRLTQSLTRELSEREMRLNSIIGSAMDGIITIDEKQHIVLFNAAAERIFGCSAREAIGSPLDWFIPERFREGHAQHVKRFGESGVTMRRMGGDMVISGKRMNGEEFSIDASISYAIVAGRKYYTVILRDITERQRALEEQRRAQQQLKESERRLNSIISSAMDALITIDEQQNIVLFNRAAETIFRCAAAEAIGSGIERFIPERYRPRHREHVRRFGEAGTTMRRMGGELVLAGLRADGEEFPIDASISHVDVAGRKFYTVILRDITERQGAAAALDKSHQELRELYESMHQVREAERTRIARELHDELAQWLTALKMDVTWIASRLPREQEDLIAKAERAKAVVDSTVGAVRRIAADLRPVMLDDLGLVPALESLLNELGDRSGIEATVNAGSDELILREPLATAIYRMVQEALTNVARHANATAVVVDVVQAGETLHVRVRDNGQGLKPDPSRKSFGLLGIRERARTLGGDARIYSPPGGGTVVEIDIPLQLQPTAGAAK